MKYYYLIIVSWIALLLYLIGFFLTRRELLIVSSCNQSIKYESIETCIPPSYSRVIMLIVDALRLDMIKSKDDNNNLNFPYMNDLLINNVSNVHLFGFQADPPTTTSQRLKGLTTGSLPTFLDISQNFNSKSIKEDNYIDQFHKAQKKLIVLGDDTWSSLYPGQFHVRYPFDSFNTRDIHTVDDGIESNMWNIFHEGNWDVFIAHFLGVDHIGHTYSSSHPYMHKRLQRMDTILKKTIDNMDNDTLLLLFGDHGMTDDGNHGGCTYEELTSGLFVFSKKTLKSSDVVKEGLKKSWDENNGELSFVNTLSLLQNPRIVRQIDLVPSLSLLMGLPIPFSNMGKIIPELFESDILLKAFLINLVQVTKYFQEYFGSSGDRIIYDNDDTAEGEFSLVKFCNQMNETLTSCLETYFGNVNEEMSNSYLNFRVLDRLLTNYQSFGRKKWTEFDELKIFIGITLSVVVVGVTLKLLLDKLSSWKHCHSMQLSLPMYTKLAIILAFIFSMSSMSNSFIEGEKRLLFLFVQALNVALFLDVAIIQDTRSSSSSSQSILYYLVLTVLCICYTRYAWSSHFNDADSLLNNRYYVFILWGKLNVLLVRAAIRDMLQWSSTMCSVFIFIISQLLLLYHLHNNTMNMYWIPRNIFLLSIVGIIWAICINAEKSIILMHLYSIAVLVLLTAKGKCNAASLISSLLFFVFSVEMLRYYYIIETRKSSSSLTIIGWVIHMCLFGRMLFYLTSHEYDFSSLQLDAGFILMDSFNFYIAGMMLLLNTFIVEILGIVILLLVANYLKKINQIKDIIILTVILFKLSAVLCSCVSAFILRRHLMVWAIFAPKVIFEISFWLVSSFILIFTL